MSQRRDVVLRVLNGPLAGPNGKTIRPTADRLRESVFNILAHAYGDPVAGARVQTDRRLAMTDGEGRYTLEISDGPIELTAEGAAPGQVLDVVRVSRVRSGNPKQGVRFHREKVGKVRVDAIVDEHFAQATVVDGKVEKGDIVRLADPDESMKN